MAKSDKVISKVVFYLNLLPIIRQIVDQIEALNDGTMTSTEKKDAALSTLGVMWDNIGVYGKVKELKAVPFDLVRPVAEELIALIVSLSNSLGRFVKRS